MQSKPKRHANELGVNWVGLPSSTQFHPVPPSSHPVRRKAHPVCAQFPGKTGWRTGCTRSGHQWRHHLVAPMVAKGSKTGANPRLIVGRPPQRTCQVSGPSWFVLVPSLKLGLGTRVPRPAAPVRKIRWRCVKWHRWSGCRPRVGSLGVQISRGTRRQRLLSPPPPRSRPLSIP